MSWIIFHLSRVPVLFFWGYTVTVSIVCMWHNLSSVSIRWQYKAVELPPANSRWLVDSHLFPFISTHMGLPPFVLWLLLLTLVVYSGDFQSWPSVNCTDGQLAIIQMDKSLIKLHPNCNLIPDGSISYHSVVWIKKKMLSNCDYFLLLSKLYHG